MTMRGAMLLFFILAVGGCSLFDDPNTIHLKDGRYEGPGIKMNIYDDAISQDGSTYYYGYCLIVSLDDTFDYSSPGRIFSYGGESFHYVPIVNDSFSVDVYGCKVEGRITSTTSLEGSLSFDSEETDPVQRDWTASLVEER